jgi:hypothetical protein
MERVALPNRDPHVGPALVPASRLSSRLLFRARVDFLFVKRRDMERVVSANRDCQAVALSTSRLL